MIKRKLIYVLGALALLVGLAIAPAAQAATNGEHDQAYTCTSGGSQFHAVVSYRLTGIGSSAENRLYPERFKWSSSPAADFDYAIWSESGQPLFAPGTDGQGNQNDVNDHGQIDITSGQYLVWSDVPGTGTLKVGGGVGNSSATCTVSHNLL